MFFILRIHLKVDIVKYKGQGGALRMIVLDKIFQDGMVLQQGRRLKFWGKAKIGESIIIKIQNQKLTTTADNKGNWEVFVPALIASRNEVVEIIAQSDAVTIKNVAIGEVWIAAGQSNMEFHMAYEKHFREEVKKCHNKDIRFFDVPEISFDDQDRIFDYSQVGTWKYADSDDLKFFSAIGYYFSKNLQQELDVPIGIIGCNWGGTPITSWIDKDNIIEVMPEVIEEFEKTIEGIDLEEYWNNQKNISSNSRGNMLEDDFSNFVMPKTVTEQDIVNHFHAENIDSFWADFFFQVAPESFPGRLFEYMVSTIASYVVRGVLWYQGESDDTDEHRLIYDKLLKLLIKNWRDVWKEELPFLVVQLPGFETWIGLDNVGFDKIRLAQKKICDEVDNVYLCSIGDIGERFDIHPKEKQIVGNRLAMLALKHIYGKDILADAPKLKKYYIDKNMVEIIFSNAGEGLYIDGESINALEVKQDGESLEYSWNLDKDKLTINLMSVVDNISIEFAQSRWYVLNMFNSSGIPAIPFKIEIGMER